MTNQEGMGVQGWRCTRCGHHYAMSRRVCRECGGEELETVSLGREGTIYAFTTIRVPPARWQEKAPYTVAVIDMEAGGRLTGVVQARPEEMAIGKRVRAVRSEEGVYIFRL
ncbi:MAG: hypothetical protein D6736_04390 [Nitrospinota bacterium]|nr:MAG: hypothetical protein D6736_04390 [Nitrospinota bacterium]